MRAPRTAAAVLLAAAMAAGAAPAQARPPRRAAIVDGVGMAGVKVGATVALKRGAKPQRVTSGPMRAWGPVLGFCFEGTSCAWRIPGGATVSAEIGAADNRLTHLSTTSRAWRTERGVHAGMPAATAQARYPDATRERTCAISPYGAEFDALVLRASNRTTAFVVAAGRVASIWVVASRVAPAGAGC
jgi:hypothetical protein